VKLSSLNETGWFLVPYMMIVGLPDTAVQESGERVLAVNRNDKLDFPATNCCKSGINVRTFVIRVSLKEGGIPWIHPLGD
jgi:hypothetical protein